MLHEQRKHDGSLPLIGVNTFHPDDTGDEPVTIELARAAEEEKHSQIERTRRYAEAHREEAELVLERLRSAASSGENAFAVLMDAAARVCTLGRITQAFFEVGGQYRRNIRAREQA